MNDSDGSPKIGYGSYRRDKSESSRKSWSQKLDEVNELKEEFNQLIEEERFWEAREKANEVPVYQLREGYKLRADFNIAKNSIRKTIDYVSDFLD